MIIKEGWPAKTVLLLGQDNLIVADITFVDSACCAIVFVHSQKALSIITQRIAELQGMYQFNDLGSGILALIRRYNWNCVKLDLPKLIEGWLKEL